MNVSRGGIALAVLAAVPSLACAQDPLAPERERKPKLASTVEFSFIAPVTHDVLDPVGLARFQLTLESLLHGTLDDTVRGATPFVKGVFFTGVLLLDRTVAKMGHEYGHIAVFNRAGYKDFLLTVGRQAPEALTFHEVFINAMIPQRHMSVQLEEDDAQDA